MALTTGPQATSPVPASLLAGKVVVISGVGPDLGRAIALRSAQAGADLVLAARTAARLENVAKEVTALGRRAAPVPTSVTGTSSVSATKETISEVVVPGPNTPATPSSRNTRTRRRRLATLTTSRPRRARCSAGGMSRSSPAKRGAQTATGARRARRESRRRPRSARSSSG